MSDPRLDAFTAAELRALHYGFRDFIARRNLERKSALPREFHTAHTKLAGFVDETKTCAAQPKSRPSTTEDLIDTTEAARILGCSAQWVRRIRKELGGRKVADRSVFPRHSVTAYARRKAGQDR
ncbi:helix-turn-helix domain-containing protein [Mycolicibacterium sp. 22603]|uniref:helix-turn-helix domain-containing protein n=1 Tax=Mycolicibacterium sp. 22603 TaxID=3453950 RepID=UPI003F86BFD8